MNINTFENELNPEFVSKARNIFTLARIKNNKVNVNGNTFTFNTINNVSQIIIDSNLNVKSTSCNCRSKYLYCEHAVATFFAIKEYFQKGNTSFSNDSLTSNDFENYINDLDSINFYNPNKIGEDIKKLCKVIANEKNKVDYLVYYINGLMSRYSDNKIYLSMISSICRQLNYPSLLALCLAFYKQNFNLSSLISSFLRNGLNEEVLSKLINDLFPNLVIDILDNPILTNFSSFDKSISLLDNDKYTYYNLTQIIVNHRLDTYFVNKYINNFNDKSSLLDKIFNTILNPKSFFELDDFELELIINYALKYGFNIEHILNKYRVNEEFIEKSISTLTLVSLNNNLKILNNYQDKIKDNINAIVKNDLASNNTNYLLTSKNLYNTLNELNDLSIFELDIEDFEIILRHIINTYLKDDSYFKEYDKNKYIYFSVNNARIYLITILNTSLNIKKYDYLLDPLDSNENEEIYLSEHLEYLYSLYLKDIENMIPTIIKDKKIKQLNNLQNYLLSSLITNEIKYSLGVELSLNTRKRFIKKEPIKLRLKIGTTKHYYIQNLETFIENVKNGESQMFGKNSFNLNISNFDEKAKLLINELPSLITNDEQKESIITSDLVHRIFDSQSSKYIKFTYRNHDYDLYISNEKINPSISIDENGVISSKELNNNSIILSGLYNDYLIDFKHLSIKKLEYINDKIKNLIYFLIKNNNAFETEDIQEKFNETVYPLIYDSSNIDERYLEKNPIKLLEIHCYLDIDNNNVINATSKYYFDNKLIDKLDKVQEEKVNNYLKLLRLYGFNDESEISNSDAVGDFLKKDLSSLKEIAKVYISEDLQMKKVITFNNYNIYLKQNNNMLKIAFEQSQFSDDELYYILKAYKRKKRYAFLSGKVIELDEETMKNLTNAIDDFNLDERNLSKEVLNPFFNILKINNYNSISSFEIEDKLGNVLNDINNYKESDYKPNDYLKDIMRPYQIEAFKWLRTLHKYNFGGVLADDMGLGKTLETIALLDSIDSNLPSIIISPKSLIYNWEKEFLKWPTTLIPYVINGNKGERKNIFNKNFKSGIVFIISYDTLRNDLEMFEDKMFNYAILDEAQAIKNMQALKTKSVKKINAEHRLVLTGTPIENSVADLWSIFDFLMPNYLFNYDRFRLEIEKGVLMNDDDAYNRIIIKTKPFILRRKKKDVLKDLPDKIEETIAISMSSEQRKLYDAYLLQVRKAMTMRDNTNKITILAMLTRLRQICISPSLIVEGEIESEKINYALDMIDNLINTDHKVLIFSQFVSALEILQKELIKKDIPYFLITGDTNSKRRLKMCEEFNQDNSNEKVFLISLKAGGTGLNLIGADTVIHLDPWWNVAIENQASDRVHRIGQQKKVTVFKLIMNNSIEEKVIELQKNKKEISDRIISNNDSDIISLSFDDYDYLLS